MKIAIAGTGYVGLFGIISLSKKHNIREMAETLTQVVEYRGKLTFDTTKPDGVPRKLIDITRLESMGWKYNIDLESGLKKTFIWYLNEQLKG